MKKYFIISSLVFCGALFVFLFIFWTSSTKKHENPHSIYVSQAIFSKHSGTFENPYRTIQEAVDHANAGDTIYIRRGVYHEKLEVNKSGKAEHWLTIRNYADEKVIIDGKNQTVTSDMQGLINIENHSYIRISGLLIENFVSKNESVPAGVLISGDANHIALSHLNIQHIENINSDSSQANAHAIGVYGSNSKYPIESLSITDCEISNNRLGQSETVAINGNVSNFNITSNKIHDNDNIGIDLIGFEGTAGENDFAREGTISKNKIWNISTSHNPAYRNSPSAAGIYSDGARHVMIEQNIISNSDIGIEAASEHFGKSTQDIIIRNNLITHCKAIAGIAFGGYDKKRGSASNIKIINNTLYQNGSQILIQAYAQYNSNLIQNNILDGSEQISGDPQNIVINHNLMGNPDFVNAGDGNFHLKKSSKAYSAGVESRFVGTEDLNGDPRTINGKINIGAFQ